MNWAESHKHPKNKGKMKKGPLGSTINKWKVLCMPIQGNLDVPWILDDGPMVK